MQATLLGVMDVNFTNNSGDTIHGMNIFVAFDDDNVQGKRCEKFFLKDGIRLPKDIKLNDAINVVFNHKGKVEMVYK